jgi:phosphatidylglycerol lysyltransferase
VPYTERARAFVDSLSVISIGALVYALISLFQPLKARFYNQSHNRELVRYLLETYGGSSEEFFKLWPQDKIYFIGENQNAALALKVHRGVALVAGDPVGNQHSYTSLVEGFLRQCDDNDWSAAFIHTEPKYCGFYERHNFTVQKIGEEAVVNLEAFRSSVAGNKYFRNIRNKFEKLGYSIETLQPPHKAALIDRLGIVSAEWRRRPGRDERGFMMGYFTPDYLNQCPVMVARDAAGTIQAFINQIPTYDPAEANFDLLQHTEASPTNINDYLLMNFIDYVFEQGFSRLNIGLCPLVGLDKTDENNSLIDSALRLAYSKGDRIYSFSGLEKFKTKYEPVWSPRFIAYRGGIRGFTRTLNALNQAMKVK